MERVLTEPQADDFFESMEYDDTGRISLAQYKEGAKKNLDIFECLKLFENGLCMDPLKERK